CLEQVDEDDRLATGVLPDLVEGDPDKGGVGGPVADDTQRTTPVPYCSLGEGASHQPRQRRRQLVDDVDGGIGIVDAGGERSHRDLDQVLDGKLRVLVGRAVRPDDEGAPDRLLELRAAALGWINSDATAVDDDIVAGAERHADQYVGLLRLHQQLLEIYGLDIAIDGGAEEAG